jgi:hypothetical protein
LLGMADREPIRDRTIDRSEPDRVDRRGRQTCRNRLSLVHAAALRWSVPVGPNPASAPRPRTRPPSEPGPGSPARWGGVLHDRPLPRAVEDHHARRSGPARAADGTSIGRGVTRWTPHR